MADNLPHLIHIGLPKTGSTALQHYWASHHRANFCWQNMHPLIDGVRKVVRQFKDYEDLEIPKFLTFDRVRDRPSCNVYSSEALSTFIWGSNCSTEQVTKARWFFADCMYNLVPKAQIVIVFRQAEEWIKSMYKQYVQEGGECSPQKFFLKERSFLSATLNLRELHDIWSNYYGKENIVFLDFDQIKNEPNIANQLLCDRLGVDPAIELITSLPKANVSLSDSGIELMHQSATWLSHLEKNSEWCSLSLRKVKQELSLVLRTELQKQGKMAKFVDRNIQSKPFDINLDGSFRAALQSNFHEYLREYGFQV